MTEIFGVPTQALMGQLTIGLVNGSFYALLSLGLAVIFGMLNVVNFAHGALYMMGAFVSWMLLQYLGINYWFSLVLAPLVVGLVGIFIEKTMLRWLYQLDHLYGLLLTFGIALIIEGAFREGYGISGQPYELPEVFRGGFDLGFMFMPKYRAWVVLASLIVCLGTWYVIEKTKLGAYLRAGTENGAGLWHQCAADDDTHLRLWCGAGGFCRRAGRTDLPGQSIDGFQHHHHCVCGGGDRRYGLHPRLDCHRSRTRLDRGTDQGVLS